MIYKTRDMWNTIGKALCTDPTPSLKHPCPLSPACLPSTSGKPEVAYRRFFLLFLALFWEKVTLSKFSSRRPSLTLSKFSLGNSRSRFLNTTYHRFSSLCDLNYPLTVTLKGQVCLKSGVFCPDISTLRNSRGAKCSFKHSQQINHGTKW